MARIVKVYDAYTDTHEETVISSSDIPGIMRSVPRLYRPGEVSSVCVSARPLGSGWLLSFDGRSWLFPNQPLFPSPGTQQSAEACVDWLLHHQEEVKIALHWITRGNLEPYLNLLTMFSEALNA